MNIKLISLVSATAITCLCSQALALDCSDPRPTPTPRYSMSPGCEASIVETPVPPASEPVTRTYCNEQKRECKRAATAKKRAVNLEKIKKRRFTKQEAKKRSLQSGYDACKRGIVRRITKLKTSAMPTALACGPSLRDLVNRNVTIDFFSCRSNAEIIQDFLIEERNRILGSIVDNVSAWIRTCALDSGVRRSCTGLEELALAAFNGDDLDGLVEISAQCRSAANSCIAEHRSEIAATRRACNKMEKYQNKARSIASGALRCKDNFARNTDRHHGKLSGYHLTWSNAFCDKKSATAAEPIICREYNKRCK